MKRCRSLVETPSAVYWQSVTINPEILVILCLVNVEVVTVCSMYVEINEKTGFFYLTHYNYRRLIVNSETT